MSSDPEIECHNISQARPTRDDSRAIFLNALLDTKSEAYRKSREKLRDHCQRILPAEMVHSDEFLKFLDDAMDEAVSSILKEDITSAEFSDEVIKNAVLAMMKRAEIY